MFNKGTFPGTYFTPVYFGPVVLKGGFPEKTLEDSQREFEQELAGTVTESGADVTGVEVPDPTIEESTAFRDAMESEVEDRIKESMTTDPDIALMLAIAEATEEF